jgi:ribokinase
VKTKFDVVGIGCSAVDYLGIVPKFPEPDVKMQMLDLTQQGGGLAATAMVTVSRLGARAAYVGKIGDDAFGRFIIGELEKEGVSAEHCVIERGGSARFAFIVVDREKGTRTILWSQKGVSALTERELDRVSVLSTRVLLVDEHEPEASLAAAASARKAGIRVVLDAERVSPVTRRLVKLADTVIVPAHFAFELTGEREVERAGDRMRRELGGTVVLTAGVKGSFYTDGAERFHQPAFDVDVVDTTGAGDVFHGAFAFALLHDWTARERAEFASAVAALKCRKLGGRAGIPSLEETLAFLSERSGGIWVRRFAKGIAEGAAKGIS